MILQKLLFLLYDIFASELIVNIRVSFLLTNMITLLFYVYPWLFSALNKIMTLLEKFVAWTLTFFTLSFYDWGFRFHFSNYKKNYSLKVIFKTFFFDKLILKKVKVYITSCKMLKKILLISELYQDKKIENYAWKARQAILIIGQVTSELMKPKN